MIIAIKLNEQAEVLIATQSVLISFGFLIFIWHILVLWLSL